VDGYPFVHHETVRFRDVDGWGHVNNAVYLTFCEEARMAFLAHLGVLTGIEDATMILARIEIDFRSQLSANEEVAIGTKVTGFGTKSFQLGHRLEAGGRLVAEASTVLVAYDYARSESVELPPTWRERLAA
jgi:acyl-CoA thioester hydrolase